MNILLITGGPDAEREISFKSAAMVREALEKKNHNVTTVDIDPENISFLSEKQFDIVFPMIHGPFGEGGPLQKILEDRKLKFVGSGSESASLAMDKHLAKIALVKAQLKVPRGLLFGKSTLDPADHVLQLKTALSYFEDKVVVKPNSDGSSVGITITDNQEEAVHAIYNGLAEFEFMLVESFVKGKEYTVGIIGDLALPVIQVRVASGFYDYNAKYLKDNTEYIFDLNIDSDLIKKMQSQAMSAFGALGCRDFGRVDFIVSENNELYILEVNTIPGMTDHSLLPMACAHISIDMGTLCDQIAQMAFERPI